MCSKFLLAFALLCCSLMSATVHGANTTEIGIIENLMPTFEIGNLLPQLTKVKKMFAKEVGLNILRNRTKTSRERIVFGDFAQPEQFPFAGMALAFGNNGYIGLCSCSLVTPDFILFAAHCIDFDFVATQFFFGSVDTASFPVVRNGLSYAIHPNYNSYGSFNDDIAVFKLASPIPLSSSIQPVKLPARISTLLKYDDALVTAVGFGVDQSGFISRFQKFALLQVTSGIQCFANFMQTMSPHLICAKSSDSSGICFGDSGVII